MSTLKLNAHKFVALCVRHRYHTEGTYSFAKEDVCSLAKKYTRFYNKMHRTDHIFELDKAELNKEIEKKYFCSDSHSTITPSDNMLLEISEIIQYLPKDEKVLFDAMVKNHLHKLTDKQLDELSMNQLKTNYHETRRIEDEIIF